MSTKLDLFADKEYDEMEWLNRALEPFIFPLNDVLASIPDRFDFSAEDVKKFVFSEYRLDESTLLDFMFQKLNIELHGSDLALARAMLKFSEEEVIINLSTMEMKGELFVLKTKPMLDEEDIKEQLGNVAYMKLGNVSTEAANIARMNELMDIIGITENRGGRSMWNKISALQNGMKTIIIEDKWRLRSAPLVLSLIDWMVDFVNNGNLAALSNVTRLKCMTYANKPIYSMQETV